MKAVAGQVFNLRRISNPPVQMQTKGRRLETGAQDEILPHTRGAISR